MRLEIIGIYEIKIADEGKSLKVIDCGSRTGHSNTEKTGEFPNYLFLY